MSELSTSAICTRNDNGSRASNGEVPASRASTRMSRASTQSRLEIDELEALLRDKVKNNYYEVRKRFKDNDPEGRGNVPKEAFLRILVTVAGRQISSQQSQGLLKRLGFGERTVIPFTEFFAHFRDQGQDSDHPQWMSPLNRPDHVVMSAAQVHDNLREKARQRFLDLADMIPQMNPGGSGRVMRAEFKQMLQKMNFYLDDAEFDKLWCKYDHSNEGVINGSKFLKSLGIEWRGQSGVVRRVSPDSGRSSRTPRRKEVERRQQLDVERWLKDKFREGFFSMRKAFEDKDTSSKGVVSYDDFLEVLGDFGLKIEKPLLGAFLSRCSVKVVGKGVPYREFLHRFQDRSETGMVHSVLTDVQHRFNNRPDTTGGDSTVSAVEGQLINMFQRDFLALLGMFKKLDRLGTDTVSQEEFRAAMESRFSLELTDPQFESFLDRVPLDEDGNLLYARFMQQFDTRGQAPSLFAAAIPERVNPKAVVLPQGTVPAEGPGAPGTQKASEVPLPTALVPDVDGEELYRRRTNQELFKAIKDLLTKRFQDMERVFQDLDESNTRRLTQDMMYHLLKRFDIRPEITRGEIRDLWRTFITNTDRTLDYHQFIRHFGFSMKSAAFPNAKLQPPRRGDADYMVRSRKLNCASDMLQDGLRSKIDYMWDELRKEFQGMDPYNTGFVSREEFREVLIELCVNLADTELETILTKFDTRHDNRVSYVEFLKPFSMRKQTWRHGNNMLSLLQHPQPELPITDIVEPPQKGLHGITANLRQKVAGDWKNIRRAFRKLDVNGNGYLSLPEFRSVLKLANVLMDEDEVYHVMTEFDRDLSGKIHYEKFIEETFKPESRRSVRSSLKTAESKA
ncbi:hypothetical protein ACOMHN_000206 [Nucella lapillus]